jgi:hypothetical protein
MNLTTEQIDFLNKVCRGRKNWTLGENGEINSEVAVNIRGGITEIPVKFGIVKGEFSCSYNNLTTLKNYPVFISGNFYCYDNPLTDYFKNLKEEDFPHWGKFAWEDILREYPFLINIGMKYLDRGDLSYLLYRFPLTKLYLE